MSSNGSANAEVVAMDPAATNIWAERDVARARRRLLSTTRYRRGRYGTADAGVRAATDESQQAWTILEAEYVQTDPAAMRRGSLPVAVAIAVLVALVDVLPAYWAAQALGENEFSTRLVTAILVAGLTGFAALMSHFRNRGEMRLFYASVFFTAVLIVVQSGLRLRFLRVVNDATWFDAVLQAGLLACISGGLVWIGYTKLVGAEPWPTFLLRRRANKLERRVGALRGKLRRAGEEYANSYESLRHLEHGRVGQDPALDAAIRRELQPDLFESVLRAAAAPKATERAS